MATRIAAHTTGCGQLLDPNTDNRSTIHAPRASGPINREVNFQRELTSAHRRPPLTQAATPVIRLATAADLPYVVSLQKRFTDELGFLPATALQEWIDRGHVTLALENGDPCAYVVTRERVQSARWCRPLSQLAVQMDAQRRSIGLALLDRVARRAQTQLLEGLQCWVASDIDAIEFFKAAGFTAICSRKPQNARRRDLILFRRSLQPFEPANFWTPPAVAGCRPQRIPGRPDQPLIAYRRPAPAP